MIRFRCERAQARLPQNIVCVARLFSDFANPITPPISVVPLAYQAIRFRELNAHFYDHEKISPFLPCSHSGRLALGIWCFERLCSRREFRG